MLLGISWAKTMKWGSGVGPWVRPVHGVVALLITLPRELWPVAPAAPDLVDQTIENGVRGFLAVPEKRRG